MRLVIFSFYYFSLLEYYFWHVLRLFWFAFCFVFSLIFFWGFVFCFAFVVVCSFLFFFLAIVFCSAGCKQAFVPKINADIIRSKPFSRSHTQKSSSLLFMGQGNSGSKHSASISRVAPTNTTFQSPLLSEIKPSHYIYIQLKMMMPN